METRVTLQSIVQNTLADTRRLSDQLSNLQTQAATGKRFTNVSDDPTTSLTILASQTQSQTIATHLDNIDVATSRLNASVSTLQQVSGIFSQARSIAVEASNSINDPTSFGALANSVDGLLDQLIGLANTQNNGTYLYAGSDGKQAPFAVVADSQGRPTSVQYQGSQDSTRMFVDQHQQINLDYSGADVFQQRDRQPTVITGLTGAAPGGGTDNATGRAVLQIRHAATTFAPGSGVQAGTSSATGDTILGPASRHQLQIVDTSGTGTSGTVSLDGGPAVAFTNADTNLQVTNASGDVVYLDTSAITPNFNGAVEIASSGEMSIDGGTSWTPLTYAADQTATDSATGKITFVNTAGVQRTGSDTVAYPGTNDVFQALMTLRDDLRNTQGLAQDAQIQAISNDMADLDRVNKGVLTTAGAQSATLQGLQSLQGHLQDMKLNADKTASDLGNVDVSQLVVNLQSYQNMLQLTLAAFSRITSQNLLDFLK